MMASVLSGNNDSRAFFILPLATCHCEQLEIKHLNNFEIYAIVKRLWHSYQRICLNSSLNNEINIDCGLISVLEFAVALSRYAGSVLLSL